MTVINADMTDSVNWVPLANPGALVPGFYTLGSENLRAEGLHYSAPARPWNSTPNGVWCSRGIGGSTAASHLSGATLTRYYPDAPAAGGGGSTSVTDGVTTVDPATSVSFPAGTISEPSAGVAEYSGGTVSLEGEQLVLLSQSDMAANVEFVAIEASDGVVFNLRTSGASVWTLIAGAALEINGEGVFRAGFEGVTISGGGNEQLRTVADEGALGFFGATPTPQPATIAALDMLVSDPPTQVEVQAVADRADEILAVLKSLGLVANV